MADLDRRSFLAFTAGLCAACALGAPVLAADAPPAPAAAPVDVGPLSDFNADGVFTKFAKNRFLLVRTEGRLYAMSNLCTHKGVPLTVKGSNISCLKHGSQFSIYGTATKKPASDTLIRYGISLADNGHVMVDTATEFREKNFEKKTAYVEIPK